MPNHSKAPLADRATPTAPEGAEFAPPNKPRRKLSLFGIVAAIVAVAAIAAAVFYYSRDHDARSVAAERAAAQDAACANAQAWTTFDYTNFDAWRSTVLGATTGKWREQFDSASNTVRRLYIEGKFSSSAKELHCGAESVDNDKARVIVGVEQTVKSVVTPSAGNTTRFFIVSDLDKIDGRWLVSNVEAPALISPTAPSGAAPQPR